MNKLKSRGQDFIVSLSGVLVLLGSLAIQQASLMHPHWMSLLSVMVAGQSLWNPYTVQKEGSPIPSLCFGVGQGGAEVMSACRVKARINHQRALSLAPITSWAFLQIINYPTYWTSSEGWEWIKWNSGKSASVRCSYRYLQSHSMTIFKSQTSKLPKLCYSLITLLSCWLL